VAERALCPAAAQAGPAVTLGAPFCTDPAAVFTGSCRPRADSPEIITLSPPAQAAAHKQPGQHTLVLSVARSSPKEVVKTILNICGPSEPWRPPIASPQLQGFLVGWWQTEYDGYACSAHTHEVALLFDSGMLDEIPGKTINRAVLSFEEAESFCFTHNVPDGVVRPWISCWTNGEGEPEPKPQGCVVVAVPTVDWRNGHRGELLNTTTDPDVNRLGPREWDVTEPFSWQVDPDSKPFPQGGAPAAPTGFGFLLRGGLSISQLEAQDNTRCTSDVSNIKLNVTFTVPSEKDDEPFRRPK
jgi:hypothetical protein